MKTYAINNESRENPEENTPSSGLCGSLAGIMSKFVMQPLDLIRTRLQAQDGLKGSKLPEYKGIRGAVLTIVRTEGILGFYTGLAPNLIASGIAQGTYFYTYTYAKALIKNKMEPNKNLEPRHHLLSGLCGGIATVLATNPFQMVTARLQLQSKKFSNAKIRYNGVFNCMKRMIQEEGIKTFYRGVGPSLTLTSNHALQLMIYEQLRKQTLIQFHNGVNNASEFEGFNAHETLMMGAIAKAISATCTYPLNLVRSRVYQRANESNLLKSSKNVYKYNGVCDAIRKVQCYEGIKGFYKGLIPHLMKTSPSAALTFSFYEYLIYFNKIKQ